MIYARPILVASFSLSALLAEAAGDFNSLGGIT